MSWHYSRALVAEYSAESCSGGELSAPLNGTPTPAAYYWPDKTTGHSRLSRFGMTSEPLTADRGEALLMLFLAASRARTSAQPETVPESTASEAVCGWKWPASFAKYDPALRLWKTRQCSLLGDLEPYSETWPQWGLMRDGECSAQTTAAPPTGASESGLWPTPRASDANGAGLHGTGGMDLRTAVQTFQTPTVQDAKNNAAPSQTRRNSDPLNVVAGGRLNPQWVEKLMGWPRNWTSLQPISHVTICFWIMGFSDAQTRVAKVLRMLRQNHVAQEIQREIGRPVGVSEAAFLLAELCKHTHRLDEARIFMACAETLETEVRGMRVCARVAGASHRPEQAQQRTREHPDTMQALSRFLAHDGEACWHDGSWEDAIPRVTDLLASRVDRITALGNGQVPRVVAAAWRHLAPNG